MTTTLREETLLAAGRHPLMARFVRACESRCGREQGDAAIVALSGGADSTALLALLGALHEREASGGKLAAVHVHHHLRSEADGEAEHCRSLCESLGIPLEVVHIHPEAGSGLSQRARELRHAAVHAVALARGVRFIFMAHHADDLLETMLMRLGRGVGQRGLRAIPWRRRARRGDSRVILARPLLCARREDIEDFCRACRIPWCDDASNSQVRYARGMLRAKVTPGLVKRWPRIAAHAVAAADAARSGAWALKEIACRDGWLCREIPREKFRGHGPVISRGLFDAALAAQGVDCSPALVTSAVEAACDSGARPRTFACAAVTIQVTSRVVRVMPTAPAGQDRHPEPGCQDRH